MTERDYPVRDSWNFGPVWSNHMQEHLFMLRRILGLGLLGIMLATPLMYSAPQGAQQRKGHGKGGGKKGGGRKAPTRGGRGG